MSQPKKPRNTISLGEVLTQVDRQTGKIEQNEDGVPTNYYMKVWIPDDVDQGNVGGGSLILKSGDYLNFRLVREDEREKMPDWKKPIAQLKAWIKVGDQQG